MKHNPQALSTAAEVKDRCLNRKTRIKTIVSTQHANVYVVIFEDGTQANVDDAALEKLHMDEPQLWVQGHHTELV